MIKATRIIIHRAEGLVSECRTVTHEGENVWQQANETIMRMRRTAPKAGGGYHKTDFEVQFADGERYEGRIDLQQNEYETVDGHMRTFLEAASGRKKPLHLSDERWELLQKNPRILANKADAIAWLDGYEIGSH